MTLLLVIDLQKEFINENTRDVVEKIDNLIKTNKYDNIVFTRFINTDNSIFVKKLKYKEGISKESKKIVIDTKENLVIDKKIYSALSEQLKAYIRDKKIDKIYLCGIDTECCILKTAFDLFENEYNVYVLKDYCACFYGKKSHTNAIEILKRNIGEEYVI